MEHDLVRLNAADKFGLIDFALRTKTRRASHS